MQSRAMTCQKEITCPTSRTHLQQMRSIQENHHLRSYVHNNSSGSSNPTEAVLPTFNVDLKCKVDDGCSNHLAMSQEEVIPKLSFALEILDKSLFSIFIVELYTESLCLLHYKVHQKVRKNCICTTKDERGDQETNHKKRSKLHQKTSHIKHQEKAPHVIFTSQLEHKLDKLSQVDVELYRAVKPYTISVVIYEPHMHTYIRCFILCFNIFIFTSSSNISLSYNG